MLRVSRQSCEDGPLLEEQETEGQRQLHSLLLQQLHTDVDIQRCVAKKQCFAPAALYRPFGEQAAGVRSLTQFQALQDGETELASLRELGLTDTEIQLWQSRDTPEGAEKDDVTSHGVCAAPGAKQQRLQVIRDKIEARAELMSRPQRFASSRPLSRREMEIERALFQGTDRLGFLTALYHRGMVLMNLKRDMNPLERKRGCFSRFLMPGLTWGKLLLVLVTESDQSQDSQKDSSQSHEASDLQSEPQGETRCLSEQSEWSSVTSERQPARDRAAAAAQINIKQPIGSLRGAGAARSEGPLTLRGEIETISDEEILDNRESEEGIRSIPRFRNYQPGKPSKVSKYTLNKNPSLHVSLSLSLSLLSLSLSLSLF
uniref:RNA binding motif protein 41 n=1 Tax=Labrus bergylta TaxID=56723 RepID=A0A3Q3FDK2_9LABR